MFHPGLLCKYRATLTNSLGELWSIMFGQSTKLAFWHEDYLGGEK